MILAAELAWAWTEGYRVIALLGLWPLLSLCTVTLFYAFACVSSPIGARLMSGALLPAIRPLLWPFQFVAWSLTHAKRAILGKQTMPSGILPRLWLGMHISSVELAALEREQVYYVVDLCAELPANSKVLREPFQRLAVPALDRCPPTQEQLEQATTWAIERMNEGHSVYVHCAFGRGRSAMLCAAIVLALGHASTANEAMAVVRKGRAGVALKGDQQQALEHFAALVAARKLGSDNDRSSGDLLS